MNSHEHFRPLNIALACAIAFLVVSTALAADLTPTTTLAAETGNNTSASSNFIESNNANAGAANTSKVSIRRLLYPGSKTKVYAHWVGWFGPSNHIQVGYKSDDPAQVHRQVEDMVSRGINGVVVDWFGPNANPVNTSTQLMKAEAEAHPGFEFIIMEDVGALGDAAKNNGCDVTTQLINDVQYAIENYASSPAYSRIDGRPVIMLFGITAYFIDWNRVRASVPGNPLFIFRGSSWFNNAVADGAFQWVDLASSDPFDPQLGAQDSFYRAATSSSKVSYGSAYTGFADGVAAWSGNRFIHQRCGRTWLATFAEIAKFYSASNQLQAMQLVTWNDYEEGTEIETGIDNCVDVNPTISGGMLTWTATGGPENTVHHYTVFISKDGQNLAKVADVPTSTHAFNLASLALPSGSYTVYVKAVGQPSIHNQMSPAIVYTPGNEPPKFSLTVTLNGATNVAASITGATDTNGFGKMQIDFGDGTVVTGSSASHTYSRVDNYTITATVFDNNGASSVVRKRITPKPPATGVTIFGPSSGTVINAPALVTATATSSANITAMRIYVDGKTAYTIDRDFIRTAVKVFKGTHHVTVQAWDAAGAVFKKEIDLIGEPNDLPPIARVTVSQPPGGSNLTVLACSATSSDPDGFISGRALQFSDGSPVISGPTGIHTFGAAGNYSVNVAVMDQFGAVGSTSLFFAVPLGGGGGGGGGTGVTVTSPADGATVASPVRFIATATSPNAPITAIAVYADYKRVALVNGASLDQSVALAGGIHSIIVQAWDATGAVFKKSLTINVSTTQGGVSVASPLNGSSVSSPVHFLASATSPNAAITAMAIYIDSQRVALVNNASIDQSLTVGAGTHYAVVQAWDATGAVFKTPLTITVSGATVAALK